MFSCPVIGMTVAIEAQSRGHAVSIFARDFPSDVVFSSDSSSPSPAPPPPSPVSQDWSSPWAGFNWCSFAEMDDVDTQRRDKATFLEWQSMVKERVLPREEMEMMPFVEIRDGQGDAATQCWFKDLVPRFQANEGRGSTSPPTVSYDSIAVSTPHYLAYLVRRLRSHENSVTFHRIETLPSLGALFSHASLATIPAENLLLVNATGLGSLTLSDVRDSAVYPIRGQTILVRAPSFRTHPHCVMSTLTPKPTYVIPRAASGVVVLGGTFDEGDWSREVNDEDTERILRDCLQLCPEIADGHDDGGGDGDGDGDKDHASAAGAAALDRLRSRIISVNVGTRPARKGETRIELDAVKDSRGDRRPIVHAYGAGKAGFQGSVGIARDVMELAEAHFAQVQG